jgi:rhodanese-related sulfurtransferase
MVLIGVAGLVFLLHFGSRLRSGVSSPDAAAEGISEVDASEAAELISRKQAVVVDVRTSAEYAAGRIPRATHVPLRMLPQHLSGLQKYKKQPIIVSCRTGRRSVSACTYLTENGFEEVYNLKGGLRAWARARQTIES